MIKKKHILFFILILIPNLLRQVIYKTAEHYTGSTNFIISFETLALYNSPYWYYVFFQEILIGIVFAVLWFTVKPLKFLSYGWISDAVIDYFIVIFWLVTGFTPFQLLNLNIYLDFFLREIFFSYLFLGITLWYYQTDIRKFSFYSTVFGILILSLIIKLGSVNLINVI